MPEDSQPNLPPELWDLLPECLREFVAGGKTVLAADDGDWTVSVKTPRGYLSKSFPPGAVLLADNGCGDHLFLAPKAVGDPALDSPVYVSWHEGPRVEVFAQDLNTLLNPPPATVTQRPPVLYHGGQTAVQLGDEVTARSFFIRRPGRVVYVPGISKKNRDMEHHGLCWVAIRFENGTQSGLVVDPKTSCLQKSVRFVKRSREPVQETGPAERFE